MADLIDVLQKWEAMYPKGSYRARSMTARRMPLIRVGYSGLALRDTDKTAFCFLPNGLLSADSALTLTGFAGRDDAGVFRRTQPHRCQRAGAACEAW